MTQGHGCDAALVGQDGILRAGWQPARPKAGYQPAAGCQPAPQAGSLPNNASADGAWRSLSHPEACLELRY